MPQYLCDLWQKHQQKQNQQSNNNNTNNNTPQTYATALDRPNDAFDFMSALNDYGTYMTVYNKESIANTSTLIDNCTTHSILMDLSYFTNINYNPTKLSTITHHSEPVGIGHGPAVITLPNGTTIHLSNAIFAPNAITNYLSFLDLRNNGYDIASRNGDLLLTKWDLLRPFSTIEQFAALPNGLHGTTIMSFLPRVGDEVNEDIRPIALMGVGEGHMDMRVEFPLVPWMGEDNVILIETPQ